MSPACEDMSPGAQKLDVEAATKHRSEDRDWEHFPLCDSDL
jgi:hypothetical protein